MAISTPIVLTKYGSTLPYHRFQPLHCVQFGAACGLLVGHGIASLATRIDSTTAVSLSTYAIVGAAAFLSGCVRYKASAVLITVESTGAWFLVVPVTIAGEAPLITHAKSSNMCCQFACLEMVRSSAMARYGQEEGH
jgi:hypothetical protein